LEKLKGYERDITILNGRGSYSKTDHDATFMRMKDDHLKNGQLKPGYNVTIGVDAEYIVNAIVTQDRSDGKTLIPFLKSIDRLRYPNIVADAGFESEENYTYLENNEQLAFIKPSNYEQAKTFLRQRADANERITSEESILLRLNRSIQVEGAFGVLKQDMGVRRFLCTGKAKVSVEVLLLCFAYNVKKLHNKIQSGRCGESLHYPEAA